MTALLTALTFSVLFIPHKSEATIYATIPPPALIPETPGPPRHGVIMFGSLATGDGKALSIFGFPAITSALPFQPPDGFRAIGSSVVVAGSGSKAIGATEHQDLD